MHHKHAFGKYQSAVEQALEKLTTENIIDRIRQHDHTVWKDSANEISNRLGWLNSPDTMLEDVPLLLQFTDEVRAEGFTHVLLLGMGGSSLAPEVFHHVFGVKSGYLDLDVLDSTDPTAVLSAEANHDPRKTLYIVATKSGGTVETFSLFKYFFNQATIALGQETVGRHFVAITDPGSGLVDTANMFNFRKIFLNDPNIGGRYSALSLFGMLPAALLGIDIKTLLTKAKHAAEQFTGFEDGVAMGVLALEGKDKLTLIGSSTMRPLEPWVEQLVAESLGKEAKGILPICNEPISSPEVYGMDRYFIHSSVMSEPSEHDEALLKLGAEGHPVSYHCLEDKGDLGAEMFRWEIATVVAAHLLKVNPFDQPNVESAKVLARNMVSAYHEDGKLPVLSPILTKDEIQAFADVEAADLKTLLNLYLSESQPGDYICLQAYVHGTDAIKDELERWRVQLRDQYHLATTLGFGPRFLHSTGQLHKGDRGNGFFIQITCDNVKDVAIPDQAAQPDSSMTFGVLKAAQALGDRQALIDAGRKVIRFHLGTNVIAGLEKLKTL